LKFKAVILDLSLPDLGGFGLMKDLAANTIGMSVVLVSGSDIELCTRPKFLAMA